MRELGERITNRRAEVLPGVSQNQLAKDVGMEPSALSRVVNGQRGLAGDELVNLARKLRTSTDWLLTGEDAFPVEIAARHGYATGCYTLEHGEDVEAAIRGISSVYRQASESMVPVETHIPSGPAEARRMLDEGYGPGWRRNIADAVERTFGVDVVKIPLPDADGFSLRLPNATVIAVPTEAAWSRQNWTLAHELGHVSAGDFAPVTEGPQPNGEKAANAFAAELLMPAELIRSIGWDRMDERKLGRFLWEYGVSLEALNNRLNSLNVGNLSTKLSTWSLIRLHVETQSPFQDPVVDRQQESAARRFPVRLIADHELHGNSPRALAWMLGAPIESGRDEDDESGSSVDELMGLFGLADAS